MSTDKRMIFLDESFVGTPFATPDNSADLKFQITMNHIYAELQKTDAPVVRTGASNSVNLAELFGTL